MNIPALIWSYMTYLWKWLVEEDLTLPKFVLILILFVAIASVVAWCAIYIALLIYARGGNS